MSRSSLFWKILFLILIIVGVGLRFWLGWVNPGYANDNHFEVGYTISKENRMPEPFELFQAYHPRLYHLAVALIVEISPNAPKSYWMRWAQMVNVTAGSLTVLIVFLYLREMRISNEVRFFALSLIALNPRLISSSAQITNDAFVILFVSVGIYFAARWLRNWRLIDFFIMTLATALAGVSKGNGLVLLVALIIVMTIIIFQKSDLHLPSRKYVVLLLIIFVTCTLLFLAWGGTYLRIYQLTGSPFTINHTAEPLPKFFEITFYPSRRAGPGVEAIADALFTFPFIDMLRFPFTTDLYSGYPRHRVSLWAQLYGRYHSLQFYSWPRDWVMPFDDVLLLGRYLILVGLLPTVLVVTGYWRAVKDVIRMLYHRQLTSPKLGRLLEWLIITGYILMIIIFTIRYRDFHSMKALYILPGVLAFIAVFARQLQRLKQWLASRFWRRWVVRGLIMTLLLLYVIDVLTLINFLKK